MTEQTIRFDDGAAYERGMGVWSRLAGEVFLDWLDAAPGQRWIDVGCGNGAFTELLTQRCAPGEVQGVDPSEAQLAFARTRLPAQAATFLQGDAMALPFDTARFDAAIMALVIFFVPDPAKGVAEMVRAVRPGGLVAAYAWDIEGGGFPFEPVQAELRAIGITPPRPPSLQAARLEALQALWTGAGLREVETREITVRRSFSDFDDFWASSTITGSVNPAVAALGAAERAQLRERVRARVPADAAGRISYASRANAVKGRVPGG